MGKALRGCKRHALLRNRAGSKFLLKEMRMDRRAPGLDPEQHEGELPQEPPAATEPLDPALAERIRESLADPRPDIPIDDGFADVDRHIADYKARNGL
jgi:hypothetical protein